MPLPFPFKRRRSVAVAAPSNDPKEDGNEGTRLLRTSSYSSGSHSRQKDNNNAPSPVSKKTLLKDFFRKGSDAGETGNEKSDTIPGETNVDHGASQAPDPKSFEKTSHPPEQRDDKHATQPPEPPENRINHAASPKSRPPPSSIQDALELKIDAGLEEANERVTENRTIPDQYNSTVLTRDEVKFLFSGAPHFLLERGKCNRFYPQVIFPWDEHDATIQHLWDRKPLSHRSFARSTIHPHLPVPDEWVAKGHASLDRITAEEDADAPKRATFDIGVFEVPNMLSMNGWEPGSVGFRYYLELPTADSIRYVGPGQPKPSTEMQKYTTTLPATTVFETMDRYNDPYAECRNGTVHSRLQLLCEGPTAWKRIGVREVHVKDMIDRLERLRIIRRDYLFDVTGTKTVLNTASLRELYNQLFSKFLHHPPQRLVNDYIEDPSSLKSQIKVLANVLAAPGVWWDLSLVEWRFRIGQVLWEVPPHPDGDLLDPSACPDFERKPWMGRGLERKWFFLQMLIASELLVRLDAAAHIHGENASKLVVLEKDAQSFNQIRSGKVNWDLIAARRFLDSFSITYDPEDPQLRPPHALSRHMSLDNKNRRPNFFSLFRRSSVPHAPKTWSAWVTKLGSAHTSRQLEGLLTFAKEIGWPRVEELEKRMQTRIANTDAPSANHNIYGNPVSNVIPEGIRNTKSGSMEMNRRSSSCWPVYLHLSRSDADEANIGGWISRSWLSGFVLPGEGINHLLMATVLENDQAALRRVGALANLYGGFLYENRSWWSKTCVVGRVLSSLDGVKECMGWMSCDVIPSDAINIEPFGETWFEIHAKESPYRTQTPRIEQGSRVIRESTPLGEGALSGEAFSLPMEAPLTESPKEEVNFSKLLFSTEAGNLSSSSSGSKAITVANEVITSFNVCTESSGSPTAIHFPVIYNVQFISAHECRTPPGRVSSSRNQEFIGIRTPHSSKMGSSSEKTRVPGHPLHKSYSYRNVPLGSLAETPAPQLPTEQNDGQRHGHGHSRGNAMIIDARGSNDKETFARAWCASVGTDAVIGRVGRTCLSCCIREAYAAGVLVVIRVGD